MTILKLVLYKFKQELRNTVGNIPMEWYSDYPHLGYDLDGKKIIKPVQGDQVGVVSDLFPFHD